ncbi:MAG: hypothetical protein LBE11_02685 [Prevotellaceae bacterium]|jgi:hypothetical protein|nr:hypothetical protein [Prevotellaceae bacterium]
MAGCGRAAKKTDVEKEGVKGRVKSLREISCRAVEKFGELAKGEINSHTLLKYDAKGNMIDQNDYKSDGSLDGKQTWKLQV